MRFIKWIDEPMYPEIPTESSPGKIILTSRGCCFWAEDVTVSFLDGYGNKAVIISEDTVYEFDIFECDDIPNFGTPIRVIMDFKSYYVVDETVSLSVGEFANTDEILKEGLLLRFGDGDLSVCNGNTKKLFQAAVFGAEDEQSGWFLNDNSIDENQSVTTDTSMNSNDVFESLEENANYTYDESTGILLFTELEMQCTIPSKEVMDRIELKLESVEAQSFIKKDKKMIINRIGFYFKSDNNRYIMFSVSRWDADEWDIPKEFGPLPVEVARSLDGKWVALHGPSDLACDAFEFDTIKNMNVGIQEVWDFINENEDIIIKSVEFS